MAKHPNIDSWFRLSEGDYMGGGSKKLYFVYSLNSCELCPSHLMPPVQLQQVISQPHLDHRAVIPEIPGKPGTSTM